MENAHSVNNDNRKTPLKYHVNTILHLIYFGHVDVHYKMDYSE